MNNPIRSFNNHFKGLTSAADYQHFEKPEERFTCPCCGKEFSPKECEVLYSEPLYLLYCPQCDSKIQQTENGFCVCENLASDIRSNNLEYDDEIDALYQKDGDTEIQIQDRENHERQAYTTKDEFGNTHITKIDSTPKVSSHSYGRIWKDGDMVYQTEGPKYSVRQDMAQWLDDNEIQDESLTEAVNRNTLYNELVQVLLDNGYAESKQIRDYASDALELLSCDDELLTSNRDEKDIAAEWFKDTQENYPEDLTLLPVQDNLTESNHHYGGAYDIEDNQYFTRDELIDFGNNIVSILQGENPEVAYTLSDAGADDMEVTICISDGDTEACVTKTLDLRKIRIPSDINKYANEFVNDFKDQMTESLTEAEEDEIGEEDISQEGLPDSPKEENINDTDEEKSQDTVSAELLDNCKKIYEDTKDKVLAGVNADIPKNIQHIFKELGGKCYFTSKSPTYLAYKADIKGYTLSGFIALKNLEADVNRLAEDVTMAFYRLNGGQGFTTPQLISVIKGENKFQRDNIEI